MTPQAARSGTSRRQRRFRMAGRGVAEGVDSGEWRVRAGRDLRFVGILLRDRDPGPPMVLHRVLAASVLLTLCCAAAQGVGAPSQPGNGAILPASAAPSASATPPAPSPSASAPLPPPVCSAFAEPIDQPLQWRAAYHGPKPKQYHYCPGWSRFGPVRPNGKWHRGFDISAPTGTPVHAAVAGALSYARDPSGWGLFARVRFKAPVKSASGTCDAGEELELLYAHLVDDTPSLVMGQEKDVAAGAVVGRVGCSGNARGMCSPSPE